MIAGNYLRGLKRMKRIVGLAIAACLVGIVAFFAAPFLLSSETVKARVEAQLSAISGQSVELRGGSSLSVYPYLAVSYQDVAFKGKNPEDEAVAEIDGLKGRIGFFSALGGNPTLSQIELIRPVFNFVRDDKGRANWWSEDSPLAKRLAGTNEASGSEPGTVQLGAMVLADAILRYTDKKSGYKTEITSVHGRVSWPNSETAALIDLEGIWNGESVAVKIAAEQPLELLKGGTSASNIEVAGNPINLSFVGELGTSVQHQALGKLSATIPSPKRLREWLGSNSEALDLVGSLKIDGTVKATPTNAVVEQATLEIEEHVGTGRLELVYEAAKAFAVNGTLAFDALTLPSKLYQSISDNGEADETTKPRFPSLEGISADLRLSAETAQLATLAATNMAGTLLVKDGAASFDIGTASMYSGTFAGMIKIEGNQNKEISLDVNLHAVDLNEISTRLEIEKFGIAALGDASIKLKSSFGASGDPLSRLNGEGIISATDGRLIGMDFTKLAPSDDQSAPPVAIDFFAGNTGFTALNMGFFVANGITHLQKAEIQFDKYTANVDGRADLARGSLAMRGILTEPVESEAENERETVSRFFVGGTITEPLFVPLSGGGPPNRSLAPKTTE